LIVSAKKLNFLLATIAAAFLHSPTLAEDIGMTESPNNAKATAFVTLLEGGNFLEATETFSEQMTQGLPPTALRALWAQLIAKYGAFKGQTGATEKSVAPGYTTIAVACEFEKETQDLLVTFDPQMKIAGLHIAPHFAGYTKPAYGDMGRFTEVQTKVGSGQWALSATLSIPNGKGPFPALVLVHGSGPNDRDETVIAVKPFRDLAWGLASRGVAVLRYEKRTREHNAEFKKLPSYTVREETIDDAVAAVDTLRHTSQIDATKIFVLGHSLGGMLIPRIAKEDDKIAGFIIVSGATRPLEDMMLEQVQYILSLQKSPPSADEQRHLESIKKLVNRIKDPNLALNTKDADGKENTDTAYWMDLKDYKPALAAQSIEKPLLILQGDHDYQVTQVDFDNWKNALSSRPNVRLKMYPGLTHVMMKSLGTPSPKDYDLAQNIPQSVIDDIADWLKQH
jgi:uncharacterized protein